MGLWPWWSPPPITSRYKREADWCTKDTTVLMAFRTLAAALSHTNLKVGVAGEPRVQFANLKYHYFVLVWQNADSLLNFWDGQGQGWANCMLIECDLIKHMLLKISHSPTTWHLLVKKSFSLRPFFFLSWCGRPCWRLRRQTATRMWRVAWPIWFSFPWSRMMCDLDTRADLIRICWHGPASAFTKVILKNIGSGWARHLVPRIWDKIKACHYMDPVRLKKRLMLAYSIAFLQFLTAVFTPVRWCCFLQGFLPLLSFWQLVMQSACALLVLRCPLLLWVLSVIVPGISEPLFPLPHQARDRNPCGFPATSPYTWPIAKHLLENCIAETWKQHTKLAHLPENGNKKLQNNCHPKKYPNNFNETLVVSIMFSTWWVPPSRQTMADISRQLNDLSWCFSLYNDKSNLVGNSDA